MDEDQIIALLKRMWYEKGNTIEPGRGPDTNGAPVYFQYATGMTYVYDGVYVYRRHVDTPGLVDVLGEHQCQSDGSS